MKLFLKIFLVFEVSDKVLIKIKTHIVWLNNLPLKIKV